MSDYIVRATAANDAIRAFAITSKDLVEEARERHNTSPIVTAALGRMLSAGSMMGVMLKGEDDLVTLQIQGSGPMKGITVTANSKGEVKGFPNVSVVDLPPKNGKLDVGGAIDLGIMRVIKDMGLKEPYVGTVELQTGEIAEDLTYYYAVSEQIPSSVGLGVLMNKDNTVNCAGGFIIQLMPFTSEEVIAKLEENLQTLPSVTDMLSSGKTPEQMLETVLAGLDIDFKETYEVCYKCDCSRDRVIKSLASLGKEDMDDIIADGKPVEVRCQFCNEAYEFAIDELKSFRKN
ncbi:molecular chaperone Hsp33 [Pseudobutyrivibrio sp. 49]|uniref:Hsp33 family molecular chaperone HslO n=1 Tax=unclassified Pseudobutyrivibrio TaxID=2638619 RepID=UPI0008917361|nr:MULTISPECIES: Hsp33 family molecular chaperone HslO [unclassified Pseudobutyrivibrio]SDI43167.1 molecular chaperone Hsp33 [Pseudobutyrivibrio sp. 49]SFN59083.1 molecular chaperone Hsp33 [Pseudobutyrivibrio sp. UC1225]